MADSTSLISLPKNWVHLNSVNKGDELEIIDLGNKLLIKGKLSNKSTVINLNDTTDKDLIWRYIVTVYRKGNDNITVIYNNETTLKEIQNFIADLIGFAIVKEEKNSITIKDLIQSDNSNLDETLRKILSLLIDMSNTIYTAINKSKKDALKSIEHADYNVNRFTNLFLRIINIHGHLNHYSTNSFYKITSIIEEIGDEYRRLAFLYDGKKIGNDTLIAFNSVNKLIVDYSELLFNFSFERLKEFHEASNNAKNLLTNVKTVSINESRVLGSLSTILHLTKSLSEESILMNL